MRVAFATLGRISLQNIQNALSNVVAYRQQVASGRKFNMPSQDPVGAERAVSLTNEVQGLDQYRETAGGAMLFLESTQASLLDIGERLREAKSIGLSQRNATADAGSREATAVAVRSIRDQIMTLLNTEIRSRHLFGGYMTSSKPFAEDAAGNVQYNGDEGEIEFRIGPNQFEVTNIPGSSVAGTDASTMFSNVDLSPILAGSTNLSTLNRGAGVAGGQFQIDVNGTVATVDTTGATTVQDVINLINASGVGAVAQINASQTGLDIIAVTPGDTLKITEVNNGVTAVELGINGTGVGVINGTDVDPALELGTVLADIPALTSLPLGSIIVKTSTVSVTTNFSNPPPATTMGEVISRFNLAIPQLQMTISPDGSGLQITGSGAFTIENNGSDWTASQLGIAGEGQRIRLFGSIEALEQALRNDDGAEIEKAVAEIELVIGDVVKLQGIVASRMQRVEAGTALLDSFRLGAETRLSDVEATDMAEAITRLSEAQALYQTALGTAASIYNLNLFHYLYG